MTKDVINALRQQTPPSFHVALLEHAKALVKMSRAKMASHYRDWDRQDQVFRGERYPDADDVEQARKGKPVKMVVPHTFGQVMTFASFLFLLFKQNQNFFELVPSGNEDYGSKQMDAEAVLARDLNHNRLSIILFQHLIDCARFGPAIFDCCWTREITRAYVEKQPTVVNYRGIETTLNQGSEWQQFVRYEGNLIRNVSPYRWFPDTRFPLVDFQRGEFCAAEEEYAMTHLRQLEAVGEVAGVDFITPFADKFDTLRGAPTRFSFDTDNYKTWLWGPSQSEGVVCVTKMQIRIVPSHFIVDGENTKLGPEEFPVMYHLWYANDNRIIRLEPAYWWHDQFSWTLSQFTPDMHRTITLGLADLIYRLQDVITWHINSRITDVRRNMRGRLVIDPSGVDTASLDSEKDIYLRSGVSKSGVDRWVKQLDVRDTTQAHMADAELLGKIMQVVTGVNDNLMGQYNSGRRSAQEARTVLGGASGRMKLHGHVIWEGGLAPLGRMMLSNSRQALSADEFVKIVGQDDDIQQRYLQFKGTPAEVVTGDDFMVFDSTLSSEKGFTAQALQELLVAIVSADPVAAQMMTRGINPVKLVEEIYYLRGAGNIKRFGYSPEEQRQIAALYQQQQLAEQQTQTHSSSNGSSNGAVHIDRSTHVTVQKPNAKK